jgi:hypothetical protein
MGLGNQDRPHRVAINVATATTTAVVAAVAGYRIVVTNLVLSIASGQTCVWKDGTTVISGPVAESYATGDNELGILETSTGAVLNLTTSAAVQVSGHLTYVLMP